MLPTSYCVKYIPLVAFLCTTKPFSAICGLPVRNQSSRLVPLCYIQLFTKSSSASATGGYLDRVKLELHRGRGTVWSTFSVHFKPITNWVPVNVSPRSRRSYGEIGDSEQSVNVIIHLPNYFITLAKGSCNKNSHFFRFRKFHRIPSSMVPQSAVPQIGLTPLVCVQNCFSWS